MKSREPTSIPHEHTAENIPSTPNCVFFRWGWALAKYPACIPSGVLRGVARLVPAGRKSPRNLWRWPPRKIAVRGGALSSWKKSMPIREVSACREAGAGSPGSWRWQARERPTSELGPARLQGAHRGQVKAAQPGRQARAGAEPAQGPALPGWRSDSTGSALAPTGALGAGSPGPRRARQPLLSEPALPPDTGRRP